jgi:hypothetical protein
MLRVVLLHKAIQVEQLVTVTLVAQVVPLQLEAGAEVALVVRELVVLLLAQVGRVALILFRALRLLMLEAAVVVR